jgi:hypothetical protein
MPFFSDVDAPTTRIDRDTHRIIRHAYEEVLTACARLVSFSNGSPPATDGPISERQEPLVVEDLIDFTIHARPVDLKVRDARQRKKPPNPQIRGCKRQAVLSSRR